MLKDIITSAMHLHSCIITTLVLLVAVSQPTASSTTAQCQAGEFLDRKSGECIPCSECPVNRIVRRRCTEFKDTVCTPFYEFEFFNQGPDKSRPEGMSAPLTTRKPLEPIEKYLSNDDDNVSSTQTKGPAIQDDEEKWKTLCFGLIGALAAIVILALCILAVQLRAGRALAKGLPLTDASGAVYVPSSEFMTPQPLRESSRSTRKPRFLHLETQLAKNKHHKRILRRLFSPGVKFWGNEYVDHVADVDANGPFLLDTIPESEASTSASHSPPQLRSIANMDVAQV